MTDVTDIAFRTVLGLLGAGMVYTAACRMRHTSKARTLARIRVAIVAMGAAGGLLVLASSLRPDWLQLAGVAGPAALLWWMAATSHAWREQQPLSAARGGAVLHRNWRPAVVSRPRWDKTKPMSDAERRRAARG